MSKAPISQDHATNTGNREMLHGMVSVALFILLGKLAAAAKEMLVAWRFGVSAEIDAYLFLFNLVNWPLSLWLGVLTAVLVPVLAKARSGADSDLPLFKAELLGRSMLLAAALTVIAGLILWGLLELSLTGLSYASEAAAKSMALPVVLLAPLGVLIALFTVTMLADGRHSSTLYECIPAVVIGASVALVSDSGIKALTWGTLAGFAAHAIVLTYPLRRDLVAPQLSSKSRCWPSFWQGFGAMLLAQALLSLTVLIDQFFAARVGEGALSTLNYAVRVLALVIGLGATVVGRAAIPIFAREAQGQQDNFRVLALRWTKIVFLGGAAAAAVVWWLGPRIVELLFERGAFTATNTAAVVEVLRAGLFQLPFNFAAVILFYALAGRQAFRVIALIAAAALLVKVSANALLVPAWGIAGIMLATATMYVALAGLYLLLFLRSKDVSA